MRREVTVDGKRFHGIGVASGLGVPSAQLADSSQPARKFKWLGLAGAGIHELLHPWSDASIWNGRFQVAG